jgi:hypothetical protein
MFPYTQQENKCYQKTTKGTMVKTTGFNLKLTGGCYIRIIAFEELLLP